MFQQVVDIASSHQVGQITKEWGGVLQEMYTRATNFNVSFPMHLAVQHKAILLSTSFLLVSVACSRRFPSSRSRRCPKASPNRTPIDSCLMVGYSFCEAILPDSQCNAILIHWSTSERSFHSYRTSCFSNVRRGSSRTTILATTAVTLATIVSEQRQQLTPMAMIVELRRQLPEQQRQLSISRITIGECLRGNVHEDDTTSSGSSRFRSPEPAAPRKSFYIRLSPRVNARVDIMPKPSGPRYLNPALFSWIPGEEIKYDSRQSHI